MRWDRLCNILHQASLMVSDKSSVAEMRFRAIPVPGQDHWAVGNLSTIRYPTDKADRREFRERDWQAQHEVIVMVSAIRPCSRDRAADWVREKLIEGGANRGGHFQAHVKGARYG